MARLKPARAGRLAALAILVCCGCGGDPRAELSSPAPGSTFPGSMVTFRWRVPNTGSRAECWLGVGNVQGWGDIYSAHQGAVTERTVGNIPTDGRIIFVRLWTFLDGNRMAPRDYTFLAARK